jgi:hypothetical protein
MIINQRVLCVDDSMGSKSKRKLLQFNREYNIRDVADDGFVRLYGIPGWWNPNRFIPLSTIDEREINVESNLIYV